LNRARGSCDNAPNDIRRGECGRSGELLTPEQRQRIDDACRAQLVALESAFPYDEAFPSLV